MDRYVDGFVIPVHRDRLEEYKRVAVAAAEIWKEHGALEYWECLGDDMKIEGTRSFVDAIGATDDEVVMFSWVVFESREARDAANEKIMSDPRMGELVDMNNPLFNWERMAFGGFQPFVRSIALGGGADAEG